MSKPAPEWVSVTEAARRAGVARNTVYAWVASGLVRAVRAGGVGPLRVAVDDLRLQPVDAAEVAS